MKRLLGAIALALAASIGPTARAGLTIDAGYHHNGTTADFTGTVNISAQTSTSATITISLTSLNGIIRGFAFNDLGHVGGYDITGLASFSATGFVSGSAWSAIGGASYENSVGDPPVETAFGRFDIGAALGGSLESGPPGPDPDGINAGETGTFVFEVTGTNLDQLNDATFASALSTGLKKNGDPTGHQTFLALRFQEVQPGGNSDVVGSVISAVPEPSTMFSGGLAALAGLGLAWRRRRANVAA